MAAEALTVDDLRDVDLFAELSDDQLRWLTTIGRRVTLGDGEVLFARGEPADAFFVLLAGELVFTVTAEDGSQRFLTRHVRRGTTAAGPGAQHDGKPPAAHQFTGEMPLMLGIEYVATATAIGRTTVTRYDKGEFAELIARFPQVSRILLPVLAWRIHASEAQAGHRATLNALGTLAAGLAHELNNPAAAVSRSAAELGASLAEALSAAESWGATAEPAERDLLDAVVHEVRTEPGGPLDVDAADALADRLCEAGMPDPDGLADDLADHGVPAVALDRLVAGMRPELLADAINLLAARLHARSSAGEISAAAHRITSLVETTRAYTNLDLAPERDFDLTQGIEATLTILAERLSRVRVRRELAPGLPPLSGRPRELNQVWTNLILNAVEAMPDGGTLTLRSRQEGDSVVVEIADDGVGIPEATQARMFQPFFTTKDVGRGPGLGLHLVHEIVERRHGGSVAVASTSGDTRIAVRLPIAGPAAAPATEVTRGGRVLEHLTK